MGRSTVLGLAFALWLGLGFGTRANAAIQPKCEVVLVPGAFGADGVGAGLFLSFDDYFADYERFFGGFGCAVMKVHYPPDLSLEERGLILRRTVEGKTTGPVWVVAHSMGGLDLKFAVGTLNLKRIQKVVFIGTPHQGSPVAHFAASQSKEGTLLYKVLKLARYDLKALGFLGELDPDFLAKKDTYFKMPVSVESASAVCVCSGAFKYECSWPFRLLELLVPMKSSDGLVPAESQKQGQILGEYRLDHLTAVSRDRSRAAERLKLMEAVATFFGLKQSDVNQAAPHE